MPNFSYKAVLPNGKIEKGVISESSERLARIELVSRNLNPIAIKETNFKKNKKYKIKIFEQAIFFRQLSVYLSSGINLDRAFNMSHENINNQEFKTVINSMHDNLKKGANIEDCFKEFPTIFSQQVLGIIKAGNNSGNLESAFEYLAEYLDSSESTRKKVLSSLTYPIFLMFFSFLIIGVLLIFVLPEVTSQFNNSQIELPFVTKMMLFASENFLYLIFALFTAVFATNKFFSAYLSVEDNRVKFHKFVLKTPLLGKVLLAYELEKFSQSILLMLRSGLNFDQSLELASSSINNSFLKKSFQQSHHLLKEGKSFLQPIKSIPAVPLIFIQLIESGYNAGTFEKSFNKIVKLLQDEIESKRTIFLSVLEPILIVTMGVFVLLIVLAILTPIMQMNSIIIS